MRHPKISVPTLFAFVLAAGLLLGAPQIAHACSCVENPPPAEALEGADYVFTGTVTMIKSTNPAPGGQSFPKTTVKLDVQSVYKGNVGGKFSIETAESSAACGFTFSEGESYIVYAYAGDGGGAPSTSLCSRTATLSDAGVDIDALGEPMKTY